MPSASRLFALLYLFSPPGKEEESAEKRKGKDGSGAGRCSGALRLRRSEAGGEVRVPSLTRFFFFFFFKGGVSLCKPMTQPHMVRSRPYRYFSLQIGSLRGLAATRKCLLALRAAEGAGQSRHSPAQPRASLETLGTLRGPAAGRVTSPSFLQDPPLPRGARHVGKRELWRASARSPGWPRLDKAPTTPAQPTCTLLGPEAPTSSWAPSRPRVPSQAREVRRGPATGGTCAPRSQIRETVPGR